MTEFLDCEVIELAAVAAEISESDFNKWFDHSPIKSRLKKALIASQRFRCCYCRQFRNSTNNAEWDLEHILCELHYPQFFAVELNLALACKRCNNAKGQEDVFVPQPRPDPRLTELPAMSDSYSIPHPHIDVWSDHLGHINYQLYIGHTPKGSELLRVCKLNKVAVEEAGLSYDAVRAAVASDFFQTMGNRIDATVQEDDAVALAAGVVDAAIELQVDAALVGLSRSIAGLSARAKRRDPAAIAAAAKAEVEKRNALQLLG